MNRLVLMLLGFCFCLPARASTDELVWVIQVDVDTSEVIVQTIGAEGHGKESFRLVLPPAAADFFAGHLGQPAFIRFSHALDAQGRMDFSKLQILIGTPVGLAAARYWQKLDDGCPAEDEKQRRPEAGPP